MQHLEKLSTTIQGEQETKDADEVRKEEERGGLKFSFYFGIRLSQGPPPDVAQPVKLGMVTKQYVPSHSQQRPRPSTKKA